MKILLILLMALCSLSCQTNAATGKTKSELIFQRVIGEHTKSNPHSYYQLCEIRANQIKNLTKVQANFKALKTEKIQVGYPFTAFVPSKEYYFFERGQKHLVARYSSTIETKASSQLVIDIIDDICGSHDRKRKDASKPPLKNGRK